jgi:hypothetical protein
MTVWVYFHQQAPGPQADPRKVVPVFRTVPRSPKGGHRPPDRAAGRADRPGTNSGYWSFFSADTAGMLRSVQVTDGTALADFRDFRRLLPNTPAALLIG